MLGLNDYSIYQSLTQRETKGFSFASVFDDKLKDNIAEKRFSPKIIKCFDRFIRRFAISDNRLACTDGIEIKVFDIHTGKQIKDVQDRFINLNLFKIVNEKLVFIHREQSVNEIRMMDVRSGENLPKCIISDPNLTRNVCIADERIFGISRLHQLVEWDLQGKPVRTLGLSNTNDPLVTLKITSPRIIHSDKYVAYISDHGIHLLDLKTNELKESLVDREVKINTFCLSDSYLFLAAQSTNLYDSYLLKFDLKTGQLNDIPLNLSSLTQLHKEMYIKNMVVQGNQIFFRIGQYIIDYTEMSILGSCEITEKGQEPMAFILGGKMFMYVTHHTSKTRKQVRKLNIRDLTSSEIHSFVYPFKRETRFKRSVFVKSVRFNSNTSTIFLEGRLATAAKGYIVLFDFFTKHASSKKEKRQLNALQNLELYKDWTLDLNTTDEPSDSHTEDSDIAFGMGALQEDWLFSDSDENAELPLVPATNGIFNPVVVESDDSDADDEAEEF